MSECHQQITPVDADLETARFIARKLCRESAAWARVFALNAGAPPTGSPDAPAAGNTGSDLQAAAGLARIEEEMFAELLAYSLSLFEMRSAGALAAEGVGLGLQVRRECSVLVERANRRRRTRHQRLPPADATLPASRYEHLYRPRDAASDGQPRQTREMFEQFCRSTGLGSEVLVGSGENLAALVFYMAVHAVRSARGLPTREQVLNLLRAARECREHLQQAIAQLVAHADTPAQEPRQGLARISQ